VLGFGVVPRSRRHLELVSLTFSKRKCRSLTFFDVSLFADWLEPKRRKAAKQLVALYLHKTRLVYHEQVKFKLCEVAHDKWWILREQPDAIQR
jgi:hypothetical protein